MDSWQAVDEPVSWRYSFQKSLILRSSLKTVEVPAVNSAYLLGPQQKAWIFHKVSYLWRCRWTKALESLVSQLTVLCLRDGAWPSLNPGPGRPTSYLKKMRCSSASLLLLAQITVSFSLREMVVGAPPSQNRSLQTVPGIWQWPVLEFYSVKILLQSKGKWK